MISEERSRRNYSFYGMAALRPKHLLTDPDRDARISEFLLAPPYCPKVQYTALALWNRKDLSLGEGFIVENSGADGQQNVRVRHDSVSWDDSRKGAKAPRSETEQRNFLQAVTEITEMNLKTLCSLFAPVKRTWRNDGLREDWKCRLGSRLRGVEPVKLNDGKLAE